MKSTLLHRALDVKNYFCMFLPEAENYAGANCNLCYFYVLQSAKGSVQTPLPFTG